MVSADDVSELANDGRQPLEPAIDTEDAVTRLDEEWPDRGANTGVATEFDFAASTDSSNDEDDGRTSIDLTDCQCLAPDLKVEKTTVSEWYIQVVFCESCERELATITERDSEVGCGPVPE